MGRLGDLKIALTPGKQKAFVSLWLETQRMPDLVAVEAVLSGGCSPAILANFPVRREFCREYQGSLWMSSEPRVHPAKFPDGKPQIVEY